MTTCIACGMPMEQPADHAMGDVSKPYCKYCAKPDGTMQSYPEKLEATVGFLIKTQGIDAQAARVLAEQMLARLPAWQNR
ncbi:MAG: zinc ribbon domain-containing protein [Ethanoligenens sp.]|uniref:zinc ribbon domain-containing protein n=1 Tax=Ethanoligenens sp. TaxID=2099655 RepID=UPI0039ED7B69